MFEKLWLFQEFLEALIFEKKQPRHDTVKKSLNPLHYLREKA
ncbi:hypothetical protein B932_3092 [Gluconobacter oxydans H24]|nr:hypothetical protein B932_3092 [Gluconobacter oxydans H24]